jgi:hypothetical protein
MALATAPILRRGDLLAIADDDGIVRARSSNEPA